MKSEMADIALQATAAQPKAEENSDQAVKAEDKRTSLGKVEQDLDHLKKENEGLLKSSLATKKHQSEASVARPQQVSNTKEIRAAAARSEVCVQMTQ